MWRNYPRRPCANGSKSRCAALPAWRIGSLKALRRISKNYFAKRLQRWRDLERQQLAICCLLRLGKTRRLPAQLADLFARTARAKPVDCPQPEALAATLQWLACRGEPSRKQNTNTAA